MRPMMLLFCLVGLAATARAGAPACPVPGELALADLALPAARAALAADRSLVILAVGGSATAGNAAAGPAFTLPARLQARLRVALPGIDVTVVNRGVAGRAAGAIAAGLGADIAATGARLVVWGAGGIDAAAHGDPAGFTDTLLAGIAAAHRAGADIVLIDPQYAPSIARVVDLTPYRDAVDGAAAAAGVPAMRRYELMRGWSEDGILDFDASTDKDRIAVARRLYDCLAGVLAKGIAGGLR